ncbi:MAG: hypothetical protein QNJ27_00680 [Simkaniaceae bacterium]|nr:hypothetical protein [Simkaniaceae bacterium]
MENAQAICSNVGHYARAAVEVTGNTKNYLGKKVEVVKGYGEAAAEKVDRIRRFAKSTKAFCTVVDQTVYGSYRGLILGGIAGSILSGGFAGAYAGARAGAQIGALLSMFNAVGEVSETNAKKC